MRAYHVGIEAAEKGDAAASHRKRNTARSQNEKEERKMSIDWEELLDAEGEDIGDAYDEAVDDAVRWMEGYDD